MIRRFLQASLNHIAVDEVWTPLFQSGRHDALEGDLISKIAERVCHLSFGAIAQLVDDIPSPIAKNAGGLLRDIESMQQNIENLSPPSVGLGIGDEIDTANKFWLFLYAAWHFRLSVKRFGDFVTTNGWISDVSKAEGALGNLVLHALESLELRFRWKSYVDTEERGVR